MINPKFYKLAGWGMIISSFYFTWLFFLVVAVVLYNLATNRGTGGFHRPHAGRKHNQMDQDILCEYPDRRGAHNRGQICPQADGHADKGRPIQRSNMTEPKGGRTASASVLTDAILITLGAVRRFHISGSPTCYRTPLIAPNLCLLNYASPADHL